MYRGLYQASQLLKTHPGLREWWYFHPFLWLWKLLCFSHPLSLSFKFGLTILWFFVFLPLCFSESAQEVCSFRSVAIGNGNIGACVNLIKGHKLFIFVINSCLFASVLSQSGFLFLIFLYPDRKSPYHPGPAPPAPLMGPRRYLEENHRARPTPLISCFGGLTALLTTSSLTLLIYFLTSHITQEFSAPKTCHWPPPRLCFTLSSYLRVPSITFLWYCS